MPNENCLADLRCPNCKKEDSYLWITCRTGANFQDDGPDDYTETEWDDDSYCHCNDCDYDGTIADFTIEYQEHPERRPKPFATDLESRAYQALDELIEWAGRMGGWEAKEWETARVVRDQLLATRDVLVRNPAPQMKGGSTDGDTL